MLSKIMEVMQISGYHFFFLFLSLISLTVFTLASQLYIKQYSVNCSYAIVDPRYGTQSRCGHCDDDCLYSAVTVLLSTQF